MTAEDYQVTFPYGATSAPYTVASPHRGDDYPCPQGTPLVIGGVTLGLTGETGRAIGPHLHVQEWHTGYADTRKPQNAFVPGTVVNIDPAGTQGDGSFGKFITIQTADGWNDTYCHLSQINVSVGQIIGGNIVPQDQYDALKADRDQYAEDWAREYYIIGGADPNSITQADRQARLSLPWTQASADLSRDFPIPPNSSPFELQAKVDSLTAANLKLTDQLKAQPTDPNSVVVTQTGLWAAFKRFLGL